jgi:hypothetical protein
VKRLLVCTIARNVAPHVYRWADLASQLAMTLFMEGWETSVSIVENDSTDGTDRGLRQIEEQWTRTHSPMERVWLSTDKLGTTQYPSVWNADRLRNLAAARQRCLDQVGAEQLATFDKVAYVEVDVTYDPKWCAELVLARHPAAAGIEPDIYSGWSLRSATHPKESTYLYDTCATRATELDTCWDVTERCGKWRGESLVPTNLGGYDGNCLHRVWSTFNCFCVYNAFPFQHGLHWDHVNLRLNTGQPWVQRGDYTSGWLDADTSVMCELFRSHAGCTNVLLNTNCLVRHA